MEPGLKEPPYRFTEKIERKLFDLDKIADSGQVFRWRSYDGGYIAPVMGHVARLSQDGNVLSIEHDGPSDDFWRVYLDLDRDYSALCKRFEKLESPLVTKSLEIAAGVRCPQQPFFESCVIGLITQNNNIRNITRCVEKLCGGELASFPDARKIIETLEKDSCSLGYRADYIKSFCIRYLDLAFSDLEELSPLVRAYQGLPPDVARPQYQQIEKRLRAETGIGPKVAAIISLFSLGYANAVPRDVWIKRAEKAGVVWDDEYAGLEQQFVFYAVTHGALEL